MPQATTVRTLTKKTFHLVRTSSLILTREQKLIKSKIKIYNIERDKNWLVPLDGMFIHFLNHPFFF